MNREDHVRDYIERGWQLFPYVDQATYPTGWQNYRNDESTLGACLSTSAPIGCILGKPSGIVVVDVDVQHDGDIRKLLAKYGDIDTLTAETPSGGWHLFFNYPDNVDYLKKVINAGSRIPDIGPGIDLLGDGQHAVMAPSIRMGVEGKLSGQYRITAYRDLADLPAALLADWLAAVHVTKDWEGTAVDLIPPDLYAGVLALHRAKVREAATAPRGSRDNTVTACVMTSVKIALNVPDEVLSLDMVNADYATEFIKEQGENIRDLEGKILSAAEKLDGVKWVVSDDRTPLPPGVREDERERFTQLQRDALLRKAASGSAARQLLEAATDNVELPPIITLEELLSDDSGDEWLIDGLLAPAQSVLAMAPKKTGKSTLVISLVHALLDGKKFLGEYQVHQPANVLYLDFELARSIARRYLRHLATRRPTQMKYCDLKGRASQCDVRSDPLRHKWALRMRELNIDVLIVDCIGPLIERLGVDENASAVRGLLDAFDTLAIDAGCRYGPIIVHHAGKDADKGARGSSAFGDWPSTEWCVTMDDPKDPGSQRRFQVLSNRSGMVHRVPVPLDYRNGLYTLGKATARVPTSAYEIEVDQLVTRLVPGEHIDIRTAQLALGSGDDHTVKKYLDASPMLVVVDEGGRGRRRIWQRTDVWS